MKTLYSFFASKSGSREQVAGSRNQQIDAIRTSIQDLRHEQAIKDHARRKAQHAHADYATSHIPQVAFPYALLSSHVAELMSNASTQRVIKKLELELEALESTQERIQP